MTGSNSNLHPEEYEISVEEQAQLLVLQAEAYLGTAATGELERIRQEELQATQAFEKSLAVAERYERIRRVGFALIILTGRAMQYAFGPWPPGYIDAGGYEEPDT